MGRYPTYPTLFNEALQLSITKLKKWDYLKKDQLKSGIISWSRNGDKIASISIMVNTHSNPPYVELNYQHNGINKNYKIHLVSVSSNLGKGEFYLFVCPVTNKRGRKLYLINGQFVHRSAYAGMYESQIKSKSLRQLEKTLGALFNYDNVNRETYSKGYTRYYKGKPTRKYKRVLKALKKTEGIDIEDIRDLL